MMIFIHGIANPISEVKAALQEIINQPKEYDLQEIVAEAQQVLRLIEAGGFSEAEVIIEKSTLGGMVNGIIYHKRSNRWG